MSKPVTQFMKDLPPWAKGVVAVSVIAVTCVAGYKLYLVIKNMIDQNNEGRTTTDALNQLAQQGIRPSYSDAQYKIWADAAEQCYQGWGTCTGDTIFVNMRNDADVLALVKAFGVRTISSGSWNPSADTTGNLQQIIRDELSAAEINAVNNILQQRGITYRF